MDRVLLSVDLDSAGKFEYGNRQKEFARGLPPMMPDLNLRHLRALGQIAREGSISAAAEAVGLSQPVLTQGVAKLEQQFGVRLFDRLPYDLRLTTVGAQVLARVNRAIALFADEIRSLPASNHRGYRPELHITAAQIRALLFLSGGGTDHSVGFARSSIRRP